MNMKTIAAGILLSACCAVGAEAQRVDNRVGGAAQSPPPRPYSAPLNTITTRTAPIGAVQSRIGANGQIMTDPSAAVEAQSRPRTTNEPQLMRALAPETRAASTPAVKASTPAVRSAQVRPTASRHAKLRRRMKRSR